MKIHKTQAYMLSSIVLILNLIMAGCGSSSNGGLKTGPGVDTASKTINLGVLAPLSGPAAAPAGIPETKGEEAFFKRVNDQGGIDGYKINLIEKDSKYDTQTQVQMYNEIHNQVLMLALSFGSPTTAAIESLVNRDKMLTAIGGFDSAFIRQNYMILVGTPYRLETENAFDYLINQKGIKNPKVGLIYQDDAFGQDGRTGYQESLKCYGFQDVGQVSYQLTDTDFSAQISQLKSAGAQYVFMAATAPSGATIRGTANALGFTPQWILQSAAYGKVLLSTPLAPLYESNTIVMGLGADWGDAGASGMAQMAQDLQNYDSSLKPDPFFILGYTRAYVTYAILKKAADSGNLTRAGLFTAFNSLSDLDLGGIYPTLHYGSSPSQRVPSRSSRVYVADPSSPLSLKSITSDFTGSCASKSQF
jgi:ABC-type branched-subunit amino acid transport system substrate-binding protein